MADLDRFQNATQAIRIVGSPPNGSDEEYAVSVVQEDGQFKLASTKLVQIESLAGVSLNASNWLSFETVSDGDTLTITIAATDQTPAFTDTFTVGVGEDQYDFAARVVLELNQDFVNFQPYHRATRVKDNSIIFIESKVVAEAGENDTVGSFTATGTGTIVSTLITGFDNYVRRTATIQASKNSDDPRRGIFGIEGTVQSVSADVSGIVTLQPYANGDPAQIDLNINGSGTPVDFTFPMDTLDDYFINEIRIFGLDSNISFGKFLGRNSEVPDAIQLIIKSDNSMIEFPPIESTDDFADKFAGKNFDLYKQSGSDKFIASLQLQPFPLRRTGTFGVGNDDYLILRVSANLTQVTKIQAQIVGVRREA